MPENLKPHLFLKKVYTTQNFSVSPKPITKKPFPQRNRQEHGQYLLSSIQSLWTKSELEKEERRGNGLPTREGAYISLESSVNHSLKTESLDSEGIKLLKVQSDKETLKETATVFLPNEAKKSLENKIRKYLEKNTKSGKPANQPLVEPIDSIKMATVKDIWSGPSEFIPKTKKTWCELWLNTEEAVLDEFLKSLQKTCESLSIPVFDKFIFFPQRTVALIKTNLYQLTELISSFPLIAEIKRATELNSYWYQQNSFEREEWIQEALSNCTFLPSQNVVTLLDSGVNNGHALLANFVKDEDKLTINSNWGVNDSGHRGHGTKMTGVIAYGDLKNILEGISSTEIRYSLESVKILPPRGEENDESKIPYLTEEAVNTAIINNPSYNRIFCMAVTGKDQNDFGKPSAWSATIDKIIFAGGNISKKELFVVSAGNVRDERDWDTYPESNLNLSVEDPAQSWNAISVGAFTQKTLPEKDTVAKNSELSPFSRTSSSWESSWPIKPEVVFEGGNLILSDEGRISSDSNLDILTTSHFGFTNNFTTINATSAAAAFASKFLCNLREYYPKAWAETLRALMIHSSSWPGRIAKQFDLDLKKSTDALKMLRIVGYGVPNLEKALNSKTNYLTFISEQTIQPYEKKGGTIKTKDIHYYEFPWPKDVLAALEEKEVTLRVTLSYFIEPNPGDRGYSSKYTYQSAALKFLLINPDENLDNFKIRTNKINQDSLKRELGVEKLSNTDFNRKTGNQRWALGADNVFKGSIHSNYWTGSAIEIAQCNKLAVFPQSSGWWKQLKKQNKASSTLRYSLIVSIETPENTEDIYTPIANQLKIQDKIKIF